LVNKKEGFFHTVARGITAENNQQTPIGVICVARGIVRLTEGTGNYFRLMVVCKLILMLSGSPSMADRFYA
jgi:hypothetical protein